MTRFPQTRPALYAAGPRWWVADPPIGDVLVVVFLRGAADGLNIVVPTGDPAYYRLRPSLAIAPPDAARVPRLERALALDAQFGLHPALAPLMPAWQAEQLAVVHACGSPDESRSHFRAMELMERGLAIEAGPASGWVARFLASRPSADASPLRALAWGSSLPRSLAGVGAVSTLRDLAEARLASAPSQGKDLRTIMGRLYSHAPGPLGAIGRETLQVVDRLEQATSDGHSALPYPETDFGRGLRQTALLIRMQLGVQAVALDLGGWDTHFAQGASAGWMARLLDELASGLGAFHADLGQAWDRTTLVVMTEFGRRARENGSLGTDHGHGSVMLLMGGHVAGGRVHAQWPGLDDSQLVGPGDLAVTTDFRDILAELCQRRLGVPAVGDIFPGFSPTPRGLFTG